MNVEMELKGNHLALTIPDEWEELTPKQWKLSVWMMVFGEAYLMDWLLSFFPKMPKRELKWWRDHLDVAEVASIAENLALFKNELVHSKSFVPRIGLLRGPEDVLRNLTWKQFGLMTECITRYGNALKSENEAEIRRTSVLLAMVLYRPWFMPFKSDLIEWYAKWFGWMLSRKQLVLVVHNAWAMLEQIEQIYWRTYDSNGDDSDSPELGFRGLSVQLAGDKFGDYYQLQKAKIHDVFAELERNAHQVMKMKEEQEASKNG